MVEIAIIPIIPSTKYKASKAEQMSGIIVRLIKAPLKVIFLSF
jgi:hypothetical protein